jgi:hypothetical protein
MAAISRYPLCDNVALPVRERTDNGIFERQVLGTRALGEIPDGQAPGQRIIVIDGVIGVTCTL